MNCQHPDCGDANDNYGQLLRGVSAWKDGEKAVAFERWQAVREHITHCLTVVDAVSERTLVMLERLLSDAAHDPQGQRHLLAANATRQTSTPVDVPSRLKAFTEIIHEASRAAETLLIRIVVFLALAGKLCLFLWELVRHP